MNKQENEGLFRSLSRIEGKQDLVLWRLDQQAKEQGRLAERIERTEDRVANVESKLNWYSAYFAGAVMVIGGVWYAFKAKLGTWIANG